MIRDTPCLRNKVADPRSRDSGNTALHKVFPGGHLTLAGSNNSVSLSARSVRYVLLDEVSRYPESIAGEGSPILLAKKHAVSFFNKKIVKHRPQPLGDRVLLRRLMRILTNAGITFLVLIVRITKPLSGRWWSGMKRNQKQQGSDVRNARKIGQNPSALNQSRRASGEQLKVIEQWQDFISQDCCRHS